jgi:hypothetical protein
VNFLAFIFLPIFFLDKKETSASWRTRKFNASPHNANAGPLNFPPTRFSEFLGIGRVSSFVPYQNKITLSILICEKDIANFTSQIKLEKLRISVINHSPYQSFL